jgi:DNA polymerase elongation subunit (family B)
MNKLLYFDMEWAPLSQNLSALAKEHPLHYQAWMRRYDKWQSQGKFLEKTADEVFSQEAGFFPEFIKIIVVSFGYYNANGEFKVDSSYGHNEKQLLEKVAEVLNKVGATYALCGHSIKRFDMPYLAKRMAFNGIPIPYLLNVGDKKPWERTAVDIAELWGFGCNQEMFTPLDWICTSLGVETSKTGISGKDVASAYWDENRLEEIKDYCEADVRVTANVERKLSLLINPDKNFK